MTDNQTIAQLKTELQTARQQIAALQAECDLLSAGSIFRQVMENEQAVFYVSDHSTSRIIYASPAYESIWGETLSNLYQDPRRFLIGIHKSHLPQVLEAIDKRANGEKTEVEYYLTRPDGTGCWIRDRSFPVFNAYGVLEYHAGFAEDITPRKQTERELLESKERLRSVIEAANLGTWELDLQTNRTNNNERWAAIVGYTLAELEPTTHETWRRLIHPDDLKFADQQMQRHLRGETDHYECETRLQHKNGHWVWVLSYGKVSARDENGRPLRVAGTHIDITERKQAGQALIESEERYRQAITATEAVPYQLEYGSEKYSFMGEDIYKITGYTHEEMIERSLLVSLIQESEMQGAFKAMPSAEAVGLIRNGDPRPWHCDHRIITRSGEERWLSDASIQICDANGNITGAIGILQDITERKLAEHTIRISEARLNGLIESAMDAIISIDDESRIVLFNAAAEQMFGYRATEMLGQPLEGVIPETFKLQHGEQIKRFGQLGITNRRMGKTGKIIGQRANGEEFPIEASLSHTQIAGKNYYTVILRDISEQQKAEVEIRQLNAELEQRVKERTAEIEATRQRLELATRSASLGIWEWNIKSGNLIWDEQMFEIYGLNRINFDGTLNSLMQIIYHEDLPLLMSNIQGALAGMPHYQTEYRITRPDGSTRNIVANGVILFDEHQQVDRIVGVAQDITQQRKAEKSIRKNEATYRALFENAHDAIFLLNPDGTYARINPSAAKLLGYTVEELTGQPALKFIAPSDTPAAHNNLERILAGETLPIYERTFIDRYGRRIPTDINLSLITDENGQPEYIQSVVRDITTRKQVEETMRLANIELERALRMKDEFLANMSHELRTPLNAILGLSESLEEEIIGPLNEKQKYYLNTITESGRHLLELINDILDLAKMEAGQIKLNLGRVEIRTLCEASLRLVKQLAQKKKQEIQLEIGAELRFIRADDRRLKQMIVNLLSNAVKFTPPGGSLGLEVRGNRQKSQVAFTVWDKGIGIKPEDLPRLFQPFTQLNAGLARESGGTGLGLALVARMARLHDGNVSVESIPGEGSRFTITLPWANIPTTAPLIMPLEKNAEPAHKPILSKGQTILLVEDTETAIILIRDYLTLLGYSVVVATDGLEGVRQAKLTLPKLILMDVQMPGMDGLEATQQIRRETALKKTPILGLTALAMPGDRERCLAAGMTDYISKPVSLKDLARMILNYLEPQLEQTHG